MKSQMTWYVKWHEISNDIKAQRQWLFKIGPEPNATSSPFVNISVPKHSPSAPDILKTPVRMLNRDPVWVKGKWLLLFSYLYEPSVSCCYNQIYMKCCGALKKNPRNNFCLTLKKTLKITFLYRTPSLGKGNFKKIQIF